MSNLDLFLRYLLPDLDEDAIQNINPSYRQYIEDRLVDLLEDEGLSVHQAMAKIDRIRDSRLSRQATRGGEPPPPVDTKWIGMASFTLAALVAGTVASQNLKINYNELIDKWNSNFISPERIDDAPDKDNVVPFYNTDSIKKFVDNFNKLAQQTSAYLNQEYKIPKKDLPPRFEFGTRTDTEAESGISRKESHARDSLRNVAAAAETQVVQDKNFFDSSGFGGYMNGIANLAGISTAAYLHYKSIVQQPIGFPPLMNFGTFAQPNAAVGVEEVQRNAQTPTLDSFLSPHPSCLKPQGRFMTYIKNTQIKQHPRLK